MTYIAGTQELLRAHGYSVKRTGPLEWTVFDDEAESGEPEPVATANSHADACRKVIAERLLS